MVEGGMTCVKYLLFAFNFIFFLAGGALIICGAVIESSFKEYFEIIGGEFNAAAAMLIAVGCIIFIIGFFGCCGAIKENHCMVITFSVLLAIIFILEIAAGIVAFKMQNDVEEAVTKGLNKSLDKYRTAKATKKAWDALQKNIKCCGVDDGYSDWANKTGSALAYPKSCCKKADIDKPKCGKAPGLSYTRPCVKAMQQYMKSKVLWIGITGVCVSFVQIIGIIFACCLARSIKKEYQAV